MCIISFCGKTNGLSVCVEGGGLEMTKSKLVKKVQMECPLCDKIHEVEERIRITSVLIKGEDISYQEHYYYCEYSDEEECEFETGSMMSENMMSARNAYRKAHNLLTSNEIIQIRENYGLTQVELAKMLGWGEATISRYESKAIQDEAYDNMLRIIRDNPLKAIEFLNKNKDKFINARWIEIHNRVSSRMDSHGKEFLSRQALKGEYVKYEVPVEANGYKVLDIDKIEVIISYYAKRIRNLYKIKLMKLLWYADARFYQVYRRSMTGLVYLHESMGALPIGHYKIMNLENVISSEEMFFDATKYHIFPNEELNEDILTKEEVTIIDEIILKFKEYSTNEIVDYMHQELAYINTDQGAIIPYSLAQSIRTF